LYAGAPFDCARIAATALMDLTAGAEVRCGAPTNVGDVIEARCSAGGYDLAEGMTYTGWASARPGADNPYRIFEQQARARGHGLWRPGYAPPPDW
jgi:endonuclease YncB( thermonuclease family)